MKPIHICFCIDDNYVSYFLVTLYSLYKYKKKGSIYKIHLLYSELKLQNLNQIKKLANQLHISITLHKTSSLINNATYKRPDFSASYLRLRLPYILKSVDKLIYLDSDLIVCSDLTYLSKIECEFIAAAQCVSVWYKTRLSQLYGCAFKKTIQGGVLVMNLKNIRKKYSYSDFVKNGRKFQIAADQDILSFMFSNNFTELGQEWNQTSIALMLRIGDSLYSKKIIEGLLLNKTKIVHYDGIGKPWNTRFPSKRDLMWLNLHKELGISRLMSRKLPLILDIKSYFYKYLRYLPSSIKKLAVNNYLLNI